MEATITLEQAIAMVKANCEAGEVCPACEQRIPLVRREKLSKNKVLMLKRAALHVIDKMNAGDKDANNFMVRDFTEPEDFKRFNFFSHLRLHGLIFKQRDAEGKEIRGQWGITKNGWSFLAGKKALPAYVDVKNNHIEGRAAELVYFRDVWRGEAEIETSFDYFDDYGNAVGRRPL
jgi:hypothetical protein